jgi:hypothetical protein
VVDLYHQDSFSISDFPFVIVIGHLRSGTPPRIMPIDSGGALFAPSSGQFRKVKWKMEKGKWKRRSRQSLNSPELEEGITPYHYEQKPYDNVQNIIGPGPEKIPLGRQVPITCQRLVEIDQSETGIKSNHEPLFPGP